MEVESERADAASRLADCANRFVVASDPDERLLAAAALRDSLVGSARRKRAVVTACSALVPALSACVGDEHTPAALSRLCATVLCSLAKVGGGEVVSQLVEHDAAGALLSCATHGGDRWPSRTAAALALRALVQCDAAAHLDVYAAGWLERLAGLVAAWPTAPVAAHSAALVLAHTCTVNSRAEALLDAGMCELLLSAVGDICDEVNTPLLSGFLGLLSAMCWYSTAACKAIFDYPDTMKQLCELCEPPFSDSVQLEAARIVSCVCDAGYVPHECAPVLQHAMPCLVRLSLHAAECDAGGGGTVRQHAMHTLARLVLRSRPLQRATADNQQCGRVLSQRLSAACAPSADDTAHYTQLIKARALAAERSAAACDSQPGGRLSPTSVATMTLLSTLALNDEEVRRRLTPDTSFLEAALRPPADDGQLQRVAAALRCLHALSRSVEQLRVTFHDRATWKTLLTLCEHEHTEIVRLATGVLCNVCLPFSPCRATLVETGAARTLSDLAGHRDASVRLNAVWALMNLTYRASAALKAHVLAALGADKVLLLLCDSETPADSPLAARLMALLRNALALDEAESGVLARTDHIDAMVLEHGQDIIKSVVYVLEGSYALDVKETALYVLANVSAGGPSARQLIMGNEDVLRKIFNYMVAVGSARLQTAAVACVAALSWRSGADCASDDERERLVALGMPRALHQLAAASDPDLFEKVKLALEQFEPISME